MHFSGNFGILWMSDLRDLLLLQLVTIFVSYSAQVCSDFFNTLTPRLSIKRWLEFPTKKNQPVCLGHKTASSAPQIHLFTKKIAKKSKVFLPHPLYKNV
jgi:hypothetical protein